MSTRAETRLRPGDRVRVVARGVTLRGQAGTVASVGVDSGGGPLVWVEFPAEALPTPRIALRFERTVRVPFWPEELEVIPS